MKFHVMCLEPKHDSVKYKSMLQGMCYIKPNKKISVFRVTGLKILGRVGTHIIF